VCADAEHALKPLAHLQAHLANDVRQRAARGITQAEDVCAVCLGRFQQVERDGRIGAIAVEKVVRPENHPPFVQLQTTDRLGDPAAVFLEADRTGVPAAAGNRDHTGSGFERRADRGVLVERASDRVET
jgi:hypothetical protein